MPRLVADRSAVRLRTGHALTVTETALSFLQDARRRGDLFRPLDWIPEVHHTLGSSEAVIPDALTYYRSHGDDGGHGSMMRAFLETDRATMGPERLAAKIPACARLHTPDDITALINSTPVDLAVPPHPPPMTATARGIAVPPAGAGTRGQQLPTLHTPPLRLPRHPTSVPPKATGRKSANEWRPVSHPRRDKPLLTSSRPDQ